MGAGVQGKWHVANGLAGSASQNAHRQRKRKRSPAETLKAKAQQIPFSLSGTGEQDELIDYYTVEPRQQWDKMGRYNSFIRTTMQIIPFIKTLTICCSQGQEVPARRLRSGC